MSTSKNTVRRPSTVRQPKTVPFKDLGPAERRVMIAKDVIAGLRSKRLSAKQGEFVNDPSEKNFITEKTDEKNCMKKALKKIEKCEVCALGACFVSLTERFNNITLGNVYGSELKELKLDFSGGCPVTLNLSFDDISQSLQKFFSKSQLAMIEYAFELGGWINDEGAEGWCLTDKQKDHCTAFYDTFFTVDKNGYGYDRNQPKLLACIMQNIIENDGLFKPAKGVKKVPNLTSKAKK